MKKILAALLALSMSAFLFAGCGNTSGGSSASGNSEASSQDTQQEVSKSEDSDAAYIENKGELIIGITYFAPMNYLDENDELTGFETDFAKAVCDKLGLTATFQEISWSAKETELASKTIDCIWNGMTITEERKTNMSISTPYMENKQVLVVKAENAEKYLTAESMKGAVIVAEKESAGESVAMEDAFFADASYTAVDTQAKGLMEVASGTADACVVDYVLSIGSIGEGTDYSGLVVVDGVEFAPEEYGIAFRKGSDFTAKVNAAITELVNDGTLADIAAKYRLEELLIAK